ncbi:MAG: hypothetical protein C6I01_05080 [Epsilonproteobacteria bacterium]|jgi:uncharacterized SAM-binding protein YcdF (DUF218 family)|nr:hypothetical protein [Campylobacterota bacterium]NPA89630.1 YdcF family protein [Campylobacterota bacterium]
MDEAIHLLKNFLLPPGIFVFFPLLLFPFLSRIGKWIAGIFSLLIYLLSTPFVGYTLAQPLQNYQSFSLHPQGVVVLGGGVRGENDPLPLSPITLKRVVEGVLIARKYNLPLIFTGGGFEDVNEGKAVKKFIGDLQQECNCKIPFYVETHSLNTYQNALFTRQLFQKLHLSPDIILITSGVHIPRATYIFRKMGFQITTLGVDLYPSPQWRVEEFIPSFHGLEASYRSLYEYLGLIWYRLRG